MISPTTAADRSVDFQWNVLPMRYLGSCQRSLGCSRPRSVEFTRGDAPKTGPIRRGYAAPVGVIFRWNGCSKYRVLCSIFIFYIEGIYVDVAMQFTRE